MTRADAEALARKWVAGEVAPEDFDWRLREWKTEKTIRDAIAAGNLDRRDFVAERERRQHNRTDTTPPEHGWEEETIGDGESAAEAAPTEGADSDLEEGWIPGDEEGQGGGLV